MPNKMNGLEQIFDYSGMESSFHYPVHTGLKNYRYFGTLLTRRCCPWLIFKSTLPSEID